MNTERFTRSVRLEVPAEAAFSWHARPGALERLVPPWYRIERVGGAAELREGTQLVLRLRKGPFRLHWVARHRDVKSPKQFVDEQVQGPFRQWIHTHRFEDEGSTGSLLTDEVEYRAPLGLPAPWIRRELERLFRYRHHVTQHDLRAHAHGTARPLRILVTGSRGMLGSHLVPYLTAGGHRVVRLLHRRDPLFPDALDFGPGDAERWENLDAVVHLAGANLAARRWTKERKRELRASRVDFTHKLAERLAGLERPPGVLVCASAIGWYGGGIGARMDEKAPAGKDFLAGLTREWEEAAGPAARRGLRVASLRFGMILSPRGGALGHMLPAYRAGLGGPLGDGRQWVSWIAIDDALDAILWALQRKTLPGPVNVVAPYPVSNTSFSSSLGRALGRPAGLRAPAWALRLALGEMADALLLRGTQAVPSRLMEDGFAFRFPVLDGALRHMLGRHLPGLLD